MSNLVYKDCHYSNFRLHERLNEDDQAAGAYTEFINNANVHGVSSFTLFSKLRHAVGVE